MKYKMKQSMMQGMKKKNPKGHYMRGSLPATRSARTVLLQMARDEERGARIRRLYAETKAARPETTWRQIADAVGVSERAAAAWPKTGGISYDNAKRLATFFRKAGHDVDVDWIWRGPELETPDVIGTLAGNGRSSDDLSSRLARLEEIALQNQRMLIALATERGLIARTGAAVELRRDLEPLLRQIEEAAGQGQPATRRAPAARRRATG